MDGDGAIVRRFYDAFLAEDWATLGSLVAEDAYWSVAGESLLAGEYKGRERVVALFRAIKDLSSGTFRPLRADSWDVLVSPHHVALMDLFLAEREGKSLRSHEAWVIELEEGLVKAGFHYLEDGRRFDDFWS